MSTPQPHKLVPASLLVEIGDALTANDIAAAQATLARHTGQMLPASQFECGPPSVKKPKRRLDPSGYPMFETLNIREQRALVEICWARCHGKASRSTGMLQPLRQLVELGLAQVAPESVSGEHQHWYAATALGELVLLKALLQRHPHAVSAVTNTLE